MRHILSIFALSLIGCALAFSQGIGGQAGIGGKAGLGGGATSGGGIAFVGSGVNGTACRDTTTTCAVSYSPTAGNTIYVGLVYAAANVVTTVTDNGGSGGSSYASKYSAVSFNAGSDFVMMWCATAASGVTTITANGGGEAVVVLEFSGANCTTDQTNNTINTTSSTTFVSGNITTTHAHDVVIGTHYDLARNNAGWGNTGGFTTVGVVNAFISNGFAVTYDVISTTQTIAATGTVTNADGIQNIVTSFE